MSRVPLRLAFVVAFGLLSLLPPACDLDSKPGELVTLRITSSNPAQPVRFAADWFTPEREERHMAGQATPFEAKIYRNDFHGMVRPLEGGGELRIEVIDRGSTVRIGTTNGAAAMIVLTKKIRWISFS